MLKQSLEGEINGVNEELGETTQFTASPAETLAQAQEDLAVTTKAFEEDTAYLKDLKRDCQTRAREIELTVKRQQRRAYCAREGQGNPPEQVFVGTDSHHYESSCGEIGRIII